FVPPLSLRYVENQPVVDKVLDDKTGLQRGDVILAVDGEAIERRRESLAKMFAASTPQALDFRLNLVLLEGQKDSKSKITARDLQGRQKEIEVTRTRSLNDLKFYAERGRTSPVVQVLPSGFGYVDLDRLQHGEVDKMFETIKNTPATIFDMRG